MDKKVSGSTVNSASRSQKQTSSPAGRENLFLGAVEKSSTILSREITPFFTRWVYTTARAVSNLRDLSEYCLPFVKVGGKFISMKSAKTDEEIRDAKEAIKVLGGEIEKINSFELADCGERTLVYIKKVRPTPTKYPRNYSQIVKNPIVSRETK